MSFIFASLTTLPHFFFSARINAANSSGVPVIGSRQRRCRDVKLIGRAREVELLGYGHEIPEVPQFHRVKRQCPKVSCARIVECIAGGFKNPLEVDSIGLTDCQCHSALGEFRFAAHL